MIDIVWFGMHAVYGGCQKNVPVGRFIFTAIADAFPYYYGTQL